MRRILLAVAALLALAAAPDDVRDAERVLAERVGKLLEAESLADRARGAHLAGERGLASLGESIRKALAATPREDDADHRAVRLACLDALIRLGVPVPGEEAARQYGTGGDEALVLLARDPGANREPIEGIHLVTSRKGAEFDLQWYLSGLLLTETKAPGQAARLLRDYESELVVYLLKKNMAIGGGGGGEEDREIEPAGAPEPREDWPPSVRHVLALDPVRGAVIVAPGPVPVYAVRQVAGKPAVARRGLFRMYYRRVLLARLLGWRPEDIDLEESRWLSLREPSGEVFLDRVGKMREMMLGDWRKTVRTLRGAGLLTEEEEAALRPRVRIEVKDWGGFSAGRPDLPKEWLGEDE